MNDSFSKPFTKQGLENYDKINWHDEGEIVLKPRSDRVSKSINLSYFDWKKATGG
jgi:hypothetical protein